MGAVSFHRLRFHPGNRGEWRFLVAVNAGKMTSYVFAGGVAAAFGQTLVSRLSMENGHLLLLGLAGLVLMGNGLFLLGYFPFLQQIEGMGSLLWRALEPLAQRLIHVTTPGQGFLFGLVWGWFPCTLVYGALLWSSAACSVASGALIMALFGLGTFPAMIGAGWLTGTLARFGGIARFTKIIAWILVGFGIFYLFVAVWAVYHKQNFSVDTFFNTSAQENHHASSHALLPKALCPISPWNAMNP